MFEFERLDVYHTAKELNRDVFLFLKQHAQIDKWIVSQLRRAAISMVINIAEGSGRFGQRDCRNFMVIARSSAFECVSCFDIMLSEQAITQDDYARFYARFEDISRILFALIQRYEK